MQWEVGSEVLHAVGSGFWDPAFLTALLEAAMGNKGMGFACVTSIAL